MKSILAGLLALAVSAQAQTYITNQTVTVKTNLVPSIVNNQVVTNPVIGLVTNYSIVAIPAPPTPAQIITNANTAVASATGIPDSFLTTAEGYFTSFNTNLIPCFALIGATNGSNVYSANHGQLWTGATLQNNVNVGQEIGGSYYFWKGLSVEALCLNSGVFNTILGTEVGPGYSFILVDTRISAILGAGERFSPAQFYVAGHLRLEKALTTHTFMGLDVGIQSGGKTDLVPQLTVLTGFAF